MTKQQAYRIIGINSRSGDAEIESAYIGKLQTLQRQLVAGQSLSIRERAQQQIVQLASARELLQNNSAGANGSAKDTRRRASQPQPRTSAPQQQSSWQGWSHFLDLVPLPKPAVIAALLLSAFMMLWVVLSCLSEASK